MSHIAPIINPNTTSRLLASLNFAIEEAKIVRLIRSAEDQQGMLVQNQTSPDRLDYLSNEILALKRKLKKVRTRADELSNILPA